MRGVVPPEATPYGRYRGVARVVAGIRLVRPDDLYAERTSEMMSLKLARPTGCRSAQDDARGQVADASSSAVVALLLPSSSFS